ncbi:hypothetical protein G7Y89_g9342 [Cudoniella acicularis]|uniref:Uncharacterized protein n=1 Tax=Cudoniella acicularis TaxID=354080 RepID=A0A8H4REU6_9HELO|nr:hypothetical protein G7Y89_g9342 [Cudoniella acicularis]
MIDGTNLSHPPVSSDKGRLLLPSKHNSSWSENTQLPSRFASAWEYAMKKLAPVMDQTWIVLSKCMDDKLLEWVQEGDKNGIPAKWLGRSWRRELQFYFNFWDPSSLLCPQFPVYGEPRALNLVSLGEDSDGDFEDDY